MGTNCVPLNADILLYCCEAGIILLSDIITTLTDTSQYLEDTSNKQF